MSQNDFDLANQGFPAMRADMNSALQALASNSSGATEPGTTYAYQWWYDTNNNILKMRNADDDAWINIASFDQANDTWSPYIGSAQLTATADELNILDGVTATTTELNLLDGITALSGSDTEIVTGTAGTDGQIGKWNADGDLIGVGTNTSNGDVVVLEDVSGSPGLPAVDGSQLTGISVPDWTVSSVTATTSGAAFDETGLPSGITELEIFLTDISGSGNQNIFVQLGTGGSPTTSGYISATTQFTAPFMYTSTARFEINHASAALALSAIIRIVKEPGTNTWVQAHTGILGGNNLTFGNGEVTLSGELDNFRLSVTGNAFDAGSFWYRYK